MERADQAPQRIADGCTLHGGEPFTAICRQCGTYMCPRCNEQGRFENCPSCRAAAAAAAAAPVAQPGGPFPFRRDGVVWGAFLRFCFERYTANFGLLTLTMICCFGSLIGLQAVAGAISFVVVDFGASMVLWGLMMLALVVLVNVLTMGVLKISLQVMRGQPTTLATLFDVSGLRPFILAGFAMCAVLGSFQILLSLVWALVYNDSYFGGEWTLGTLLVGGLLGLVGLCAYAYVSLGVVFACIEIVARPELPVIRALKNAWQIARGERLTVGFGLFLIWLLMLAGTMFCFVGLVFTLGYACLLFAALYLALRNGAPVADS